MLKKLLKIQEAASFLNVSIRTLQRYDKKGLLVPLRTPGGQRRYLIDKLEEFKKSRSSNPSDLEPLVFGYPKALRVKRQRLSKTHLKKAIKLKDSLFENSSNLVTVQNAAYILGVSAMTLRRWDKAKILVPLRTIGGQRRYLRDQVEALQRQSLEKSYNPEAISFARGRLGASRLGASKYVPSALQKPSQRKSDFKTWQKPNLDKSIRAEETSSYANSQRKTYFPLDLGTPIKIDKPKEKPFAKSYLAFEFSKSQKAILFSSLFVFAMFLVITIFAKTNLLKLHLLEDLFLSSSPPTKDVAGLYNEKGIVLGEHTDGNNLFFNINVPSIFKGIATFSAGLITDNQDINAGTGTVTASNVLYEVVAGSGISIEGDPQRPTIVNEVELTAGSGVSISGTKISNTGVLSLGGKTGDVKLSAGTGISISDVTITNSGVTSLTGTTNQVTVSGSTGSVTLSLPQSIGASSSPSFAGLTLSNFTSNGGVIYTNASGVLAQVTAGTSTQCLLGGTTPAFGACGAEADTFWNQSSGALFPNNATVDLLIGATATTSAKFAAININSGTPTATISANSGNNATYLTGDGTLATTNRQSLTIGNSSTYNTTGNVLINSNGTGNVGIGTTTPSSLLHIAGQCVTGDTLLRRRRKKSKVEGGWDPEDDHLSGGVAPAAHLKGELHVEITMESGKALYLKEEELVLAGFTSKMNHNDNGSNGQYPDYSNLKNEITSRSHSFFARFAIKTAATMPNIAAEVLNVNTSQYVASVNRGRIGIDSIQPAARLAHNPDSTINTSESLNSSENFFTEESISYGFIKVKDLVVGNYIKGEKVVSIKKFRVQSSELDWEDVRIDQIREEDEIQTLDETTGEFVPRKIEKLMDMGIRPVFKLTTKSGKTIRTTGNHPYLVNIKNQILNIKNIAEESPIEGAAWVKVVNLSVGDKIAVVPLSGTNELSMLLGSKQYQSNKKNSSYQKQTKSNSGTSEEILNIHSDLLFSDNQSVNSNASIPSGKFIVNDRMYSSKDDIPKNPGATSNNPNQPDVKFAQIVANTSINVLEENNFTYSTVSKDKTAVNEFAWDEIVSIEQVGEEQVYDIEVEGTHNFVAGHYINRKTGKALTEKQEKAYLEYRAQKTRLSADSLAVQHSDLVVPDLSRGSITQETSSVKFQKGSVDLGGVKPPLPDLTGLAPHRSRPAPRSLSQIMEEDVNQEDIVYGGIVAHNTYINSSTATGVALDIDANSLTTGTGLDISSTATAFNGELLTLSKTGASGSTAFTSDIANITYSQTFDAGVGLDSTGNVLDISRAITLNNATNTHTISGALLTISDSGTQTAGTLTWTGDTVRIAQNYTGANAAALNITTASTDTGTSNFALRVNDDGTFTDSTPFVIDEAGNVGIGTTGPLTDFATATGDFTSHTGIHIEGGTNTGILAVEGDGGGKLVLADGDGSANDKIIEFEVDGGVGTFRWINDDLTTRMNNILSLDVTTGQSPNTARVGIGEAANTTTAGGILNVAGSGGGVAYGIRLEGGNNLDFFYAGTGGFELASNSGIIFDLDEDNNGTNTLSIRNGGNTTVLIVEEAGNVGIGDTGPDTLLDILASEAANNGITIAQTNASDFDPFIDFQLTDGTTSFRLGVDDSDNDTFKIGTTALETGTTLTIDSRTTTSGVSTFTLAGIAPTIASAATAEYTTLTLTPPTITLTGTTGVTSTMDSLLFNAPTITDSSAVTVTLSLIHI